jgi:hypothetical protein
MSPNQLSISELKKTNLRHGQLSPCVAEACDTAGKFVAQKRTLVGCNCDRRAVRRVTGRQINSNDNV